MCCLPVGETSHACVSRIWHAAPTLSSGLRRADGPATPTMSWPATSVVAALCVGPSPRVSLAAHRTRHPLPPRAAAGRCWRRRVGAVLRRRLRRWVGQRVQASRRRLTGRRPSECGRSSRSILDRTANGVRRTRRRWRRMSRMVAGVLGVAWWKPSCGMLLAVGGVTLGVDVVATRGAAAGPAGQVGDQRLPVRGCGAVGKVRQRSTGFAGRACRRGSTGSVGRGSGRERRAVEQV